MKYLLLIIAAHLFVFCSCSRDYMTEAGSQDTLPGIDRQMSLAKGHNNDLLMVIHAKQSPVIDGKLDKAWHKAPKNRICQVGNLTGPLDGPKDLSAYFQIMWDDNNLYLFIDVTDDELNVSNPNFWENDGMQIYFDGDNSKNSLADCSVGWPGAYDSNDNQLTAIFGQDVFSYPIEMDVSVFDFAYHQQKKGYTIEAALPFSALFFTATEGHRFGFNLQVNDDDGGVWQNVLSWMTAASECQFLDPSSWGTAVLVEKRHGD